MGNQSLEIAKSGTYTIDPLENIKDHPVYISAFGADNFHTTSLQEAIELFYNALDANTKFVEQETYAHVIAIDTDEDQYPLGDCTDTSISSLKDTIKNCGYDLAGEILKFLLPNIVDSEINEVTPRDQDWQGKGILKSFN
jgi:hypothetical protein